MIQFANDMIKSLLSSRKREIESVNPTFKTIPFNVNVQTNDRRKTILNDDIQLIPERKSASIYHVLIITEVRLDISGVKAGEPLYLDFILEHTQNNRTKLINRLKIPPINKRWTTLPMAIILDDDQELIPSIKMYMAEKEGFRLINGSAHFKAIDVKFSEMEEPK